MHCKNNNKESTVDENPIKTDKSSAHNILVGKLYKQHRQIKKVQPREHKDRDITTNLHKLRMQESQLFTNQRSQENET